MTFVKVKDHEWLDVVEGITIGIDNDVTSLDIHWLREETDEPRYKIYYFPTLSEALTAAEKIIGSCEPVKSSPFPPLTLADITPKQSY